MLVNSPSNQCPPVRADCNSLLNKLYALPRWLDHSILSQASSCYFFVVLYKLSTSHMLSMGSLLYIHVRKGSLQHPFPTHDGHFLYQGSVAEPWVVGNDSAAHQDVFGSHDDSQRTPVELIHLLITSPGGVVWFHMKVPSPRSTPSTNLLEMA
jgi:hypothetical protein